jgi:purine-nucleoside phosphorylase
MRRAVPDGPRLLPELRDLVINLGRYGQLCAVSRGDPAPLRGFKARGALILGSGMGFLGDRVRDPRSCPTPKSLFRTFPPRRAQGRLCIRRAFRQGGWQSCRAASTYVGHSFRDIAYTVGCLNARRGRHHRHQKAPGAPTPRGSVGDLMLITDHIKNFHDGPLRGANEDAFGTRFPDMTYAYAPSRRRLLKDAADWRGLPCARASTPIPRPAV